MEPTRDPKELERTPSWCESNDLAQRLRSLYQMHNCENELPAHDDLVAKLAGFRQEDLDTTKNELDFCFMPPISYEKALETEKRIIKDTPLTVKLIWLYDYVFSNGIEYVSVKCQDKQKEEEGFLAAVYFSYGFLKTIPSAVKILFFPPIEENAKKRMEGHNKTLAGYFEMLKINLTYFLNS